MEVEKQLKQDFFFSKKEVDVTKKISVNLNQATLDELVQVIFGEGFGYRLVDNLIVITPKTVVAKEEEKTVLMKGQVVDKGGDPLPGVPFLSREPRSDVPRMWMVSSVCLYRKS